MVLHIFKRALPSPTAMSSIIAAYIQSNELILLHIERPDIGSSYWRLSDYYAFLIKSNLSSMLTS
jgi:hypothetical protein